MVSIAHAWLFIAPQAECCLCAPSASDAPAILRIAHGAELPVQKRIAGYNV